MFRDIPCDHHRAFMLHGGPHVVIPPLTDIFKTSLKGMLSYFNFLLIIIRDRFV